MVIKRVSNVLSIALDPSCAGFCAFSGLDRDADGTPDQSDNCIALANAGQSDSDSDGIGDACDVPVDYDTAFSVAAGDAAAIGLALAGSESVPTFLYLPPGDYNLSASIVIDRTAPLYIHGAGRFKTRLISNVAGDPIIRVLAGSHLNLSNMRLQAPAGVSGVVGVSVETSVGMHVELNEGYLGDVGIELLGPVFFRSQGVTHAWRGRLETQP